MVFFQLSGNSRIISSFNHIFYDTLSVRLIHSQKKRKDSLETWTDRAVLGAYVENQAILGPILPYRVSKYKPKGRLLRLFVNSNFTFLCDQYQGFFFPLSRYKHFKIKLCQKSVATLQRNKLALYETQNGGPNYQIEFSDLNCYLGASYKILSFKNYRAELCGAYVMQLFYSTECLKTLREFNLFFENIMKTSCCFFVSFK